MKWLAWTNSNWRRRAFLLLTTILIICIASNPELAAFVPVLDALGLDVLLYLFAAQLSFVVGGKLLPFARHVYQRWVRIAIRCTSYALSCLIGGYLRQLLWHMKQAGALVMVFGPNNSFKPNPHRGGA
jgi:hypothetical protein